MNSVEPVSQISPISADPLPGPVLPGVGDSILYRACPVCSSVFIPRKINQMYDTRRCSAMARGKKYQANNKETILARRRAHYLANADKMRARGKLFYQNNRAKRRAVADKWLANNKERFKEIQAKSRYKTMRELKGKVYSKLGGKCATCGESRPPVLSVDHINGGGNMHRKSLRRDRRKYYKDILSDESGRFQILCMNCQWMKRHVNGEHSKRAAHF